MNETAEAVIVGGGVVGSSIAHHLTRAGVSDVLVLERGAAPGEGSTGRAMGGVRAQFASPAHIRMSLHSIDFFAHFEEHTGSPSGYLPRGYLLLATRPEHLERLRVLHTQQEAAGLHDVEILSSEEIAGRVPVLHTADVLGGAFRQGDGFIDPLALVRGFARSAEERGARFRYGVAARGIERTGDRVGGVTTSAGTVATPVVVNAAGPWAAEVARMAGVELPVTPLRRQIARTHPLPGLPTDLPLVIDLANGCCFRPDFREDAPSGLRITGPDPADAWGHHTDFDPALLEHLLPWLARRAPGLGGVRVDPARCTAGLYAVSPDHHAILGEAEEVRGLFFANGFSGHGVMHSPATGRILAELITQGRSTTFPEAAEFGPDRFRTGRLLHEGAVF